MSIYSNRQRWKYIFIGFAVIIAIVSFLITNNLINRLEQEERKKVELWAMGMRILSDINRDDAFAGEVISNNETVPVILTDKDGNIISHKNLDPEKAKDSAYLQKVLKRMAASRDPIKVELLDGDMNYIYYKDSLLLKQLFLFPLIQILVVFMFLYVAYQAFSALRKAEQNKVWVGMSKETAHQLGTPTSSLLANIELLKLKNIDEGIIAELEKDIYRLEKITERFSKIGSTPYLEKGNIIKTIYQAVNYIKARSSEKINFNFGFSENEELMLPYNEELFEWVIENLCKNAIDAMDGIGGITIKIDDRIQFVFIDIEDTGKGISKSKYNTVFQPGYTSKKRGWGLGLSLSKRIIEIYHKGKIFVHQSEMGKGTIMRIVLKK